MGYIRTHGRRAAREGSDAGEGQADQEGRRGPLVRAVADEERGRLPRERARRVVFLPGSRGAPLQVQAPVGGRVRADRRGQRRRHGDRDRIGQGHAEDVPAELAGVQRGSMRREGDRPSSPPRPLRWHHDTAASRTRPQADAALRCSLRDDDEGLHDRERASCNDGPGGMRRCGPDAQGAPVQHPVRLLRPSRAGPASDHVG